MTLMSGNLAGVGIGGEDWGGKRNFDLAAYSRWPNSKTQRIPTRDYQRRGVKPGPNRYADVLTHHIAVAEGFEPPDGVSRLSLSRRVH